MAASRPHQEPISFTIPAVKTAVRVQLSFFPSGVKENTKMRARLLLSISLRVSSYEFALKM